LGSRALAIHGSRIQIFGGVPFSETIRIKTQSFWNCHEEVTWRAIIYKQLFKEIISNHIVATKC
jgi:hypothetical protein